MKQQADLFCEPIDDLSPTADQLPARVPPAPLARSTDPETSQKAAEEMIGRLKGVQQRVYETAAAYFPPGRQFTANKLATFCVSRFRNEKTKHETYRKRVREIERQGLFMESGVMWCDYGDQEATAFEVVAKRDFEIKVTK